MAAGLLCACAAGPDLVPVTCSALSRPTDAPASPTSVDTLHLIVHVDRSPGGSALVRVDPLSEEGVVRFEGTPSPGSAAVGMALTLSGTFQGCVARDVPGFLLRAPEAPRDKAWVRVSSDRPVRVQVQTGQEESGSVRVVGRLVVEPGASGRVDWGAEGGA